MNTKTIGDRSEAIIMSALLKAGFTVSIPFGENQRYDFIADNSGKLLRIQCKTGVERNGCVCFNTCSTFKTKNGAVHKNYTPDEIDLIMVYAPFNDKIYLVPAKNLSKSNMKLRVKETADGTKYRHIKWANDYEFNGKFD